MENIEKSIRRQQDTTLVVMEHYLFLSSRDSMDQHPSNASTDFTVELPKAYHFQGDWEIALKELECRVAEDLIYVLSDITAESYVNGTLAPVLRSVRREKKRDALFTFTDPYYLPVRPDQLSRVRMFIRGRTLQPIKTDTTVVYCTLHLRRKTWM